jgi:hypothetical protein
MSIAIKLDECVSLLSEQAQIYDSANSRAGFSYRRSAAVHDFDPSEPDLENYVHDQGTEDGDAEQTLEEILEVNVNAQRDQKSGRYVPQKKKGTGNPKRQAKQMERRRSYMDGETWKELPDDDKKAWDQLSEGICE